MFWIFGLAAAAASLLALKPFVHWFQLESYQLAGYFRCLRRNLVRALTPGLALSAVLLAVMLLTRKLFGETASALITLPAACAAGWRCGKLKQETRAKKPLVYTPRVKRLHVIAAITFLAVCIPLAGLSPCAAGAFPLLLPLWLALAGLLAWPLETLINRLYQRSARKKLEARPDLLKIGITGSYGKTSVKFMLQTILREKYQVLATPGSFNTPMGLTRVIREQLEPSHQIFLAEMGARHRRDIKDLCRLVRPQMGILTSVGPQHLETFGSLENIRETKFDLMRAVPADGVCFFPDDQGICTGLFHRLQGKEKHLAGLNKGEDTELWAEDIRMTPDGSEFVMRNERESVHCETKLLGEHNIQNILLAASAALRLGLTMKQAARGIARLEPVAHRLQLLHPASGIHMIDDAFNCNPAGAARALSVLKVFPGKRIIVTPGMVELGEQEESFNRSFGRQMAGCVDLALLVGRKHTQPIAEGMREAGFDEKQIRVCENLDEAMQLIRQLAGPGDTVLFENDLPDNYGA